MRGSEFAELTAFTAIVEHGSFARAAAQMGISPSALSQTIRGLEERLGVRLLNRTTRSVAPTEAGERLIAQLVPALRQIEAAIAEVDEHREQPGGSLKINVARSAATDLLAPILGRFHEAYPRVRLEVFVDDSITDIVAGRFDAGIRLGERLEKDMVAVPIGGELELAAVASPGYVARHGSPQTPADLHQHRCINFRMPTDGNLYRWEFQRGREELDIAVQGPLIANDMGFVLQAARQGVGIAYSLLQEAQPWIDSGELVRLLQAWSPRFPGFYLYYPSRRQVPAALRALIELLRTAR